MRSLLTVSRARLPIGVVSVHLLTWMYSLLWISFFDQDGGSRCSPQGEEGQDQGRTEGPQENVRRRLLAVLQHDAGGKDGK